MVAFSTVLLSADLPQKLGYVPDPAPTPEPARPDILLLPKPADAVPLALADLKTLPQCDWCYYRYIYIPTGERDAGRIVSLALNYISRGSVIRQPDLLANNHLVRVDLRWYAPRSNDLAEWVKLWDEFSFDPTFNILITRDSLNFAAQLTDEIHERTETITIDWPGGVYTYPDDTHFVTPYMQPGKYTVTLRYHDRIKRATTVDVIRENAPHLPQGQYCELQHLTHSCAPLVEWRYFLTRALSTIQDKGVFAQVFGGLYYQLRGIRKSTIKGATDLDLFFEELGIGNIKAGLTQERLFDSLRSDQRLAVFRSDITGKPREVTSFHVPSDREGGAWGAITGDVKDEKIDIGDRAFANLLNPRRDAREAIFPTRTGLSVFALFNGAGALQDEVPPDIAIDSGIPAPYTRRLQPAIGCLRCHSVDGSDGWKPLVNDVKRLLAGRLDIFGDLSRGRSALDAETVDRLAGLYAGDFSKNLRRARDDVAEVTLRATGSFNQAESQADIAKVAAQKLADAYADYNYTLIDARKALREMGLDVAQARAVDVFRQLMDLPTPDPSGVYLEKPTIAAIAAGIGVLRADWALVQSEAQGRFQSNLKKVQP